MAEVTRNWNVERIVTYSSPDVWTEHSINHLTRGECDMAMCAVWLSENRAVRFDLTDMFDFNCGTFLVAKSTALDASANIGLSMTPAVWALFLASFVASAVAMVVFSSAVDIRNPQGQGIHYGRDISRSVLDLINIGTNHGLEILPSQSSLKWIVMR